MAVSKSLVFGFLFLAVLALVNAEPEANPSYGKPAAKVVHYHEEPVSRYVYSRHVHYEPAHEHVVKYYAYPHVHEAYVNHHHEHLVDYHHHH